MSRITVFDKELYLHIPVLISQEGQAFPYVITKGKITQITTAYHSLQGDLLEVQAMILHLQSNQGIPPVVGQVCLKHSLSSTQHALQRPGYSFPEEYVNIINLKFGPLLNFGNVTICRRE